MGKQVLTLADIMNAPVDGSGYHESYGMLGSNKANEEKLKLFPRNCQPVVEGIQARIKAERGLDVEVMVYGDGAFKDPVGGIWELADPVVSPAYTAGLAGKPNELKLKFLADNDFADLSGEALQEAIRQGGPGGGHELRGHHPPAVHRPAGLPVRPHLRLRGQGDSLHRHPELLQQLRGVRVPHLPARVAPCRPGFFCHPVPCDRRPPVL